MRTVARDAVPVARPGERVELVLAPAGCISEAWSPGSYADLAPAEALALFERKAVPSPCDDRRGPLKAGE